MPKRSKTDVLDDTEEILNVLRLNSNVSLNSLAEKLGFSRQKIWRIIKNLEKKKIIWGYTTVVDDQKLGYKQYLILLKRSNKTVTEELLNLITSRHVKEHLAKTDIHMIDSYFVHGDYDWVISISARDIKQVKITVEFFYTQLKEYISDVKILEVLFPLEKSGIENPNPNRIKDLFL